MGKWAEQEGHHQAGLTLQTACSQEGPSGGLWVGTSCGWAKAQGLGGENLNQSLVTGILFLLICGDKQSS